MPGGLLSAISGILAGGILGFGAAGIVFCWTPLQDLALWSGASLSFMSKIF